MSDDQQWRDELLDRYCPEVWGSIDTGDGWRPLVEFLYDQVDNYRCVTIAQVKEKFGGLRFYISHDHECDCDINNLFNTISVIENLSTYICELCGRYGHTRTDRSYIRTLCDDCEKK